MAVKEDWAVLKKMQMTSEWKTTDGPRITIRQRNAWTVVESKPASHIRLIQLDGDIGCGKTEFLRQYVMSRSNKVTVLEEPISSWTCHGSYNYLKSQDAFLKQMHILNTYISREKYLFQSAQENPFNFQNVQVLNKCITERGPLSAMCFLPFQSSEEHEQCFKDALELYYVDDERLIKPKVIIYVDVDEETLLQNIRWRGRPEESHIDSSFMKKMKQYHYKTYLNEKRYAEESEFGDIRDRLLFKNLDVYTFRFSDKLEIPVIRTVEMIEPRLLDEIVEII